MNKQEIKALLKDVKEVKEKISTIEKKLKQMLQDESRGDVSSDNIEKLRQKWIELKEKTTKTNDPQEIINNFIKNVTKNYLKEFIRVNNLNIDPRNSKEKIARDLLQILKISEIIKEGKPI